jgi:hypothetical protein
MCIICIVVVRFLLHMRPARASILIGTSERSRRGSVHRVDLNRNVIPILFVILLMSEESLSKPAKETEDRCHNKGRKEEKERENK